ncbi:L-type lectin-domain containing receptor kinase S.6-like [Papaver somniferum]|uniref:L-type lectin-domain containing receptor kinase S.6-like n=1 Tax=Papaver somniferum TaxID=3469 RepID=UPI000E700819|nr:L-type lectin-domain containing receptor kinase S.6-like [Papaver somniferum]
MVSSKSLFSSLIIIIIFILISFDSVFDNVSIDDIILVGDSRFQENGLISLTSTSSPSSSGRALYGHPIRFRNHSTNFTASFISKFSFTISPDSSYSPPLFGDGLTFIITSNPEIVGNDFGYMGIWNQTTQEKGFYIAVEFDTSFDPILEDINAPVVLSTNPPDMVDSKTSTSFGFDQVHGILKDTSLLEETREDAVDNLIDLRRKMKNVS